MANKIGGPGAALIKKKLRYAMGDANVLDRYLFSCTMGKELRVEFVGGGSTDTLRFTTAALESACRHVVFNQGSAVTLDGHVPPGRISGDLPPFLLSRAVFASLKSTGKANFTFEWDEQAMKVSVKSKRKATVRVDGQKTSFPVLNCVGSLHECKFWVVDDDQWPIILKHEEGDGGFWFWKILEAGDDLEPQEEDEDAQ